MKMQRPPFRLRIRDLAAGKTVAEKYGDYPSQVVNAIATVWAMQYRRGLHEWCVQIYRNGTWCELNPEQRRAVERYVANKFAA